MSTHSDVAGFCGLAALWGSAFVATEAALAAVPPVLLAALRFDLAAALLVALALARGDRLRPARGDWTPVLTGGAFTIGLHHALLFAGQVSVSSAAAAVLLGLIPVLTPAVARAIRPSSTRRLGVTGVAGLLVGFGGVLLLASSGADAGAGAAHDAGTGSSFVPGAGAVLGPGELLATAPTAVAGVVGDPGSVGVLLVLGSAVAFVLGAVCTREDDATLDPIALQAWMAGVGAVLLHLAAAAVGETPAGATWTAASIGWLCYLAAIPGAGGFLLYFRLLDRLGPIQMGLLEYAIPPFAALFAWLVLGAGLSASTVVGFLAVLVAFALVKAGAIRATLRRRLA